MSHDPCSRSAVNACWFPAMSSSAMRRVSSGVSGGNPVTLTGTNLPLTSMCGRLPGEKIRSLTRVEARSIAESNIAAGIGGFTTLGVAAVGTGTFVGLSRGALLTLPAYVVGVSCTSNQGHGHSSRNTDLVFAQESGATTFPQASAHCVTYNV